jgi:hypothetical protein
MPGTSRLLTASAAVGGLMLLGIPAVSRAQHAGSPHRVGQGAALAAGSIHGVVTDEKGVPVPGAMVSAIGAVTTFAVTDRSGRFELSTLTPGPYLVRAHRSGYTAPRGEIIDVRASARAGSSIALRRAPVEADAYPVLAAGVGLTAGAERASEGGQNDFADAPRDATEAEADQSETAWRIRHARRGVLKDAVIPREFVVDADPVSHPFVPVEILGRAIGSPARIATSFFADTPFSGQLNLLTTSSFDTPRQLFSGANVARGIAYARVGAPVGTEGDWTVRGAITQADISAWLVAGSYKTRAPAAHRYEFGMSYSTQRYDGGNPLALRDVADGSRNAGAVYGFDTFTITPAVVLTYGGKYAQYDYLGHRALFSPRVELSLAPTDELRITTTVSRRAHAPGAEEFLPPGDSGIWLPPQRTFSSLEPGRFLEAERTLNVAVELERDLAQSTFAFRAFRQHVDDQLVTLFGAERPSQPIAKLGHYLIGNAGDVTAQGCSASFRTLIVNRVQGSIAYSLAKAELAPASDLRYLILLAPSAVRPSGNIHDVATTIQADVPETSTRVLVLYRVSNAFARSAASLAERAPDRPGFDSRFDVQVRQSLPFLDFTAAKWEMLVAVRNFFRETSPDQSVYDELLSVRPPKRIVGGVTVHF